MKLNKFFITVTLIMSILFGTQTFILANNSEPGQWTATYYGNTYKTARRTANGDHFDMNAMTCAAPKKYKFGTKLKVTNLANNKSVVVKVTDRGRFGHRTIDLTYGAFGKLAKHSSGRIKIKVEVVKEI